MKEYDEKDCDCHDTVLPKIYISDEAHEMSLYSYLFSIRTGGCSEVWRFKGDSSGGMENTAVQSLFQGRV